MNADGAVLDDAVLDDFIDPTVLYQLYCEIDRAALLQRPPSIDDMKRWADALAGAAAWMAANQQAPAHWLSAVTADAFVAPAHGNNGDRRKH